MKNATNHFAIHPLYISVKFFFSCKSIIEFVRSNEIEMIIFRLETNNKLHPLKCQASAWTFNQLTCMEQLIRLTNGNIGPVISLNRLERALS
jgi:hypothetical protein